MIELAIHRSRGGTSAPDAPPKEVSKARGPFRSLLAACALAAPMASNRCHMHVSSTTLRKICAFGEEQERARRSKKASHL